MDGFLWPGVMLGKGVNVAYKTTVLFSKQRRESGNRDKEDTQTSTESLSMQWARGWGEAPLLPETTVAVTRLDIQHSVTPR